MASRRGAFHDKCIVTWKAVAEGGVIHALPWAHPSSQTKPCSRLYWEASWQPFRCDCFSFIESHSNAWGAWIGTRRAGQRFQLGQYLTLLTLSRHSPSVLTTVYPVPNDHNLLTYTEVRSLETNTRTITGEDCFPWELLMICSLTYILRSLKITLWSFALSERLKRIFTVMLHQELIVWWSHQTLSCLPLHDDFPEATYVIIYGLDIIFSGRYTPWGLKMKYIPGTPMLAKTWQMGLRCSICFLLEYGLIWYGINSQNSLTPSLGIYISTTICCPSSPCPSLVYLRPYFM